jgi:hypothetical protein
LNNRGLRENGWRGGEFGLIDKKSGAFLLGERAAGHGVGSPGR